MYDRPDNGKIWHQALTTQQSVRIRRMYAVIGDKVLGLFEPFEMCFLHELDVESAITHYENATREFSKWRNEHPESDIQTQKKVIDRMRRS